MKLLTKLTLFSTLSTLAVVIFFVMMLPDLVRRISLQNTNAALGKNMEKAVREVRENGIDYYLNGDSGYAGYSMLKDEYISIQKIHEKPTTVGLETAPRIVEGDTITYRIITRVFQSGNQSYLLEIGKKITAIKNESRALQEIALYVLLSLMVITLILNLVYTRFLLQPLGEIIRTRLAHSKFPFGKQAPPVKTGTSDFRYLDESITGLMQQINRAFEKEREFTSNASHELMTPVSIMQSKIENLLSDPGIPALQYEKLEELTKTLNRLKKIVKALLLISRIENEQYVRNDQVKPKVLLNEVVEELSHRLEENRLSLHMDIKEELALKNLNRDLLFQMFYNVIHNAIRYNKPGGSIQIDDEYINNNTYIIRVSDTGIGIQGDQLEDIFNRFKKSSDSQADSNGLGLSIVKSIVTYQGMAIRVSSKIGKGSTFEFQFNKNHIQTGAA